jgi:hypothetical protein
VNGIPVVSEPLKRLSHPHRRDSPELGRKARLARESLILVASMFAASGCLVADPPEYHPPAQTPPLIDMFQVNPPAGEIIRKRLDDPIPFNIPIRSEDAGDPLVGALYTDYGRANEQFQRLASLDASTFDDETRFMTFPWNVSGIPEGCHLLSLLVCHRANFNFDEARPFEGDDKAIVHWWLVLAEDESEPVSIEECLATSQTSLP